jgi:hypothetical protein
VTRVADVLRGRVCRRGQVRMDAEAEGILGELEDRWTTKRRPKRVSGAAAEDITIDLEKAKTDAKLGIVPTAWLLGMFAGCLPLQPRSVSRRLAWGRGRGRGVRWLSCGRWLAGCCGCGTCTF